MQRPDHPETLLRLKCLELAIAARLGDPVADGQRFYEFVTDAVTKTLRQLIDEALEAAGVR